MRKKIDNPRKYRLYDCIVTDNKSYSGYGVESGPTGMTGDEVVYEERKIIKKGIIILEKDKKARNYLHPAAGSPGSDLCAGLFSKHKDASFPPLTGSIMFTFLNAYIRRLTTRRLNSGCSINVCAAALIKTCAAEISTSLWALNLSRYASKPVTGISVPQSMVGSEGVPQALR